MATKTRNIERTTVVGVFASGEEARRAVEELHRAGFTDKQIGVVSQGATEAEARRSVQGSDTYAEEGALAGAVAGAGLGAAWAVGIAAGVLPGIGPVIAGGTLAAILASAGIGAAAGGLAGALIGLGIPEDEAEYYETEFKSGRTLVTVRDASRYDEAAAILRRHGGHTQERTGQFTRASFATSAAQTSHSILDKDAEHAKESCPPSPTTHAKSAESGKRVQLKEEELHVQKQPKQTGEVRVKKEVVTEHKTIEVPVRREEVVVERHPVSGRQPAQGDLQAGQEIRVPVTEEEIRVEKTPVVKEEVTVSKRTVEETEKVDEDLRRERLKVEREGDVKVRGESHRS
jgi:uncharacterized protein (TIGR02271 family)